MSKDNIIIRPRQEANGRKSYGIFFTYDTIGQGDEAQALCYMPTLYLACCLVRFINGGNMTKDEREMIDVALRRSFHGGKKSKPAGEEK